MREVVVCKWRDVFSFSYKGNLIFLFFTRNKFNETSRIVACIDACYF